MESVGKAARLPFLFLVTFMLIAALTPLPSALGASVDDALLERALHGDLQQVRALLDQGASVNAQDSNGRGPLHMAALACNRPVAAVLIKKGAKVNAKDGSGNTPLVLAADASPAPAGMMEFVRFLLAKGADVNARSKDGSTPLHTAALGGKVELAALLIKKGAKVNATDHDGVTPLALAVQGGQGDEVVKLLLSKGANVNAVEKDGYTPLHRATNTGSEKVVRLLLAKGAHVNAKTKEGETPLHLASMQGFSDIARLLVNKRADVTAKDAEGMTAWDRAVRNRNDDVAVLLKKAMAARGAGETVAALAPAARATFQKGLSAAEQEQWPKAVQWFLQAQEIDPISPQVWFNLGFAESNIPDHELRALAWYQAYLAKVPDAPNRRDVLAEMDGLGHRLEQRYASILSALTDLLNREKSRAGVNFDGTVVRIAEADIDFGRAQAGLELLDAHFAKELASGAQRASLSYEIGNLTDALAWAGLDDEAEKYEKLLEPDQRYASPVRMRLLLDDGNSDAFLRFYEGEPAVMASRLWTGGACRAIEKGDKALLDRLARVAEESTNPSVRADLVGLLVAIGRVNEAQAIVKELSAAEPGPLYRSGTLNKSRAISYMNGTSKLCEGTSYTKEGELRDLLFRGRSGVTIDDGQGPSFDERFIARYIDNVRKTVDQRTSGLASDRGIYDVLRMVDRIASVANAYREIRGRYQAHVVQ